MRCDLKDQENYTHEHILRIIVILLVQLAMTQMVMAALEQILFSFMCAFLTKTITWQIAMSKG